MNLKISKKEKLKFLKQYIITKYINLKKDYLTEYGFLFFLSLVVISLDLFWFEKLWNDTGMFLEQPQLSYVISENTNRLIRFSVLILRYSYGLIVFLSVISAFYIPTTTNYFMLFLDKSWACWKKYLPWIFTLISFFIILIHFQPNLFPQEYWSYYFYAENFYEKNFFAWARHLTTKLFFWVVPFLVRTWILALVLYYLTRILSKIFGKKFFLAQTVLQPFEYDFFSNLNLRFLLFWLYFNEMNGVFFCVLLYLLYKGWKNHIKMHEIAYLQLLADFASLKKNQKFQQLTFSEKQETIYYFLCLLVLVWKKQNNYYTDICLPTCLNILIISFFTNNYTELFFFILFFAFLDLITELYIFSVNWPVKFFDCFSKEATGSILTVLKD